jgi:hypothetical protein
MWSFIRRNSHILGYLAIVLVVFGKAILPPVGWMIFGDDIHHQYYFYRQFFNEWIGRGIFPWWNPYLFGGEPFVANPIVNIWYPPNWLFSLLPLNLAYSWHLAFHIFWAMLGMYTLLKTLNFKLKNGLAAWTGGVIFGLSGFFAARIFAGHVDMIAAASWMPWVIWGSIKYQVSSIKERGRWLLVAAGTFAMQLLAGYQTMAFFTAIAVGVIASWRAAQERSLKPLWMAGLAGAAGLGLAAFHILPVAQFFTRSIRSFSFPYAWNSYGALRWESLKQLLSPFYFGNQYAYAGPVPNLTEHAMFIGVVGLILAIIGAFISVRKKGVGLAFLALALFGLWVSLGPNASLDLQYILWKILPVYHSLRIPPRHLVMFVFGAAALAGMGLAGFQKTAQKLIAVVVVIELILFARSFIELRPVPETRHDEELIAFLKKDDEPYRVLQNFGTWLPQRDALDFDSVMSYGIFSATGYDVSILRNYYEYVARASGRNGEQAVLDQDVQIPYLTPQEADEIDFLNIKYILVPPAYDPFMGISRYQLIREDAQRDYRLYENTTVQPRFYLENPACGGVSVTSYTPNRIELSVDSSCDTKLLSSEVFYPGWEAYVDGKRTDIALSNGAFRTLSISSGDHRIVFQYQPKIFLIGLLITALTALTLWYYSFRRKIYGRSR